MPLISAAVPIQQPRMRFFYANGKPLVGGKVYSYKVGTSTFKPTFRNAERTALNQNPIILDEMGSALIYLIGSHVLKVYDKSDALIETRYVPFTKMRTYFYDKLGKPLSGGKVETYDAASTIKKASYQDGQKAVLNTNPVILDENGSAIICMDGYYRLRVYDAENVVLGDQDYYIGEGFYWEGDIFKSGQYYETEAGPQPPRIQLFALTSKPYPLEHDDDLATKFRVFDTSLRKLLHEQDFVESFEHSFRLGDFTLRDIMRSINIETEVLEHAFRLSNMMLKTAIHSTEVTEQLEHSFRVGNLVLDDALITNTMETEALEHAFRLDTIVRNG